MLPKDIPVVKQHYIDFVICEECDSVKERMQQRMHGGGYTGGGGGGVGTCTALYGRSWL